MPLKLLHSLILISVAALTEMGEAVAAEDGGKPTKGKPPVGEDDGYDEYDDGGWPW